MNRFNNRQHCRVKLPINSELPMYVLVANLGSTSFKYSLFDMDNEKILAKGRVERIGEVLSPGMVEINGVKRETNFPAPDHAVAVRYCLEQLAEPKVGAVNNVSEIAAIGFKAVHAAGISGVRRVDAELLDAMEEINDMMPAHNPPYVRAMRILAQKLPDIPLVAAFETDFHQTIPNRNRYYGVPFEWANQYNIIRYGFHGASHRYIALRTVELLERNDLKVISMHLGGSSSLCAINAGKSVAASMGASAQTGLFHNNRVGDFDPFVIPYLIRKTGKTHEEILNILATKSGLLGLSGVSGDLRDVINAAEKGHEQARLAVDVLIGDIRKYLGAYLVELGGADLLVFTGGIGEHNKTVRKEVCSGLEVFGIILDPQKNAVAEGETAIHAPESKTQIWIVPTNEELIVARQTKELIVNSYASGCNGLF
ncbi:MAG: acetate/propionate family kinase [Planctomycetaceae bacterium]|nr:acetate/propionate family kinase [Planctomycetaceae bacterium]